MILRCIRRVSTTVPEKLVDDYTHCIHHVRKMDYENFICTSLLRPSSLQRPVMAIRALNVELSLVRDQVSNNQIGQMRLQFWRETIDSIYALSKTNTTKRFIVLLLEN